MSEKRKISRAESTASLATSAGDSSSVVTIRSRKQLINEGIKVEAIIDQMTADQLTCAKAAFSTFDYYGTGMVSITNLRQLLRTLGFNPTEEEVENVINEYAVEGTSEIDFKEFQFILAPMMVQDDLESELREIVRAFDPGRVGAVEAMEVRDIMDQMPSVYNTNMTSADIDRMLAFIDKNCDGLLSVQELKRAVEIYQQ